MRRIALLGVLIAIPVLLAAAPAGACGGLVGENGTIQLTRTSTLAAYHDGVERYVTNFEFTGEGAEVGSIVPLPGVPTDVKRGGDWTLQRLEQEVRPPIREAFAAASTANLDSAKAQVILETKIDALDITVLKGGSEAVGKWALDHGVPAHARRAEGRWPSTRSAARSSWPPASTPAAHASSARPRVTARRSW